MEIPIYHSKVLIVEDEDVRETIETLTDGEMTSADAKAATLNMDSEDIHYMVVFEPKVDNGIIVHECVHLATMILNSKGYQFDPINDEPYAYLVQYLFDTIAKELARIALNATNTDKEESKRYQTYDG